MSALGRLLAASAALLLLAGTCTLVLRDSSGPHNVPTAVPAASGQAAASARPLLLYPLSPHTTACALAGGWCPLELPRGPQQQPAQPLDHSWALPGSGSRPPSDAIDASDGGDGGKGSDEPLPHKPLLPLAPRDVLAVALASAALLLAASGGIGGGAILVPVNLMLLGEWLGLRGAASAARNDIFACLVPSPPACTVPPHIQINASPPPVTPPRCSPGFSTSGAVALSNITIVGGTLANLAFNVVRRHPLREGPLIDWDLIMVMEPSTILGALVGGYLNKVRGLIVAASQPVCLCAIGGVQYSSSRICSAHAALALLRQPPCQPPLPVVSLSCHPPPLQILPGWLTTVSLSVLLSLITAKTFFKGREIQAKEAAAMAAAAPLDASDEIAERGLGAGVAAAGELASPTGPLALRPSSAASSAGAEDAEEQPPHFDVEAGAAPQQERRTRPLPIGDGGSGDLTLPLLSPVE